MCIHKYNNKVRKIVNKWVAKILKNTNIVLQIYSGDMKISVISKCISVKNAQMFVQR